MADVVTLKPIVVTADIATEDSAPFDFVGAVNSGAPKKDIVKYLEQEGLVDFNFAEARKQGASDDEIFDYLYNANVQSEQATDFQEDTSGIAPGMPESEYADEQQTVGPEKEWQPGTPGVGTLRDVLEKGGSEYAPKPKGLSPEVTPEVQLQRALQEEAAINVEQSGLQSKVSETVAGKQQYLGGMLFNLVKGDYDIKGKEALEAAAKELKASGDIDGYDLNAIGGPVYYKYDSDGIPRKYPLEASMLDALAASKFEAGAAVAAGLLTKSPIATSAAAGLGATIDAYSAGANTSEAIKTGAAAGATDLAIGGTITAGGKLASSAIEGIDKALYLHAKLKSLAGDEGISRSARYQIYKHRNNPELTDEVIKNVLKGVPKEDQSYILSRFLDEQNLIKQAVRGDGDEVAALLRADLLRGKAKIKSIVGDVDMTEARLRYDDTKNYLRETEGTIVRDASILKNAADTIINRFRPPEGATGQVQLISDKGYGTAVQLRNLIDDTGGKLTLSQAFEMRPELNSLIRKSNSELEKRNLKVIKDGLDDFINTMSTPEQKARIDEAINLYRQTSQNRDVLEIIDKNTVSGVAVNWTKVHSQLSEAGLRTQEAVNALRVAEAFSKKFGNDYKLVAASTAQGSSPDAGGALGAYSALVNFFKNKFALWGNRAENIRIQKAIVNTIKNSKTDYDFVDNLLKNKSVPDEFKKGIDDVVKPFTQAEQLALPYKEGAHQTGDVNLNPIITPVGGTTKIEKPTEVPLEDNASIFFNYFKNTGKVDGIDIVPNGQSAILYKGRAVLADIDNGVVNISTDDFDSGSGLGTEFYKDLYKALDASGLKHNVTIMSKVGKVRIPLNIYRIYKETGKLPLVGGISRLNELMANARNSINNAIGKDITKLSDKEIEVVANILAKHDDFRLSVDALKTYRDSIILE